MIFICIDNINENKHTFYIGFQLSADSAIVVRPFGNTSIF